MANPLPIMVVEDDPALREALTDTLEIAGYSTASAANAEQALAWLDKSGPECKPGLILTDVQMPGMDGHALLRTLKTRLPETPVILMTAYGQIDRAVQAMRDGAADYLPKPFEPDNLLAAVARHFRQADELISPNMVAQDPASLALLELARRVAASDATILLSGESGVGKEVYARYIHQHSMRAKGPFVALNCAAIPENLLESVLFGHEKGAFTGAATPQPGKFEQANGGILLLDEISELPINLQAKLLRVLQEREVERVGGRTLLALDVRVIAATNRDLSKWVAEGRFRDDLYYRLNVFPLEIPPLRERRADIPALAKHFLKRHEQIAGRSGFSFTGTALTELTRYDWPGNIRELGNVVQRAMILAPSAEIGTEHLMLPMVSSRLASVSSRNPGDQAETGLKDIERDTILNTLQRMQGSRRKTAEALLMSERTLRHKLKQYREAGFLDGDDLL
ncbi:MAG: sigma-54-dependent Fis family transcriptional regulator [Hydrogenophilales bacterium 28-61-23]|nr:MAG: sigma-54-dependent Fis family transcriptional regulator [Hydrogenophilales bacterium 28-61-23]